MVRSVRKPAPAQVATRVGAPPRRREQVQDIKTVKRASQSVDPRAKSAAAKAAAFNRDKAEVAARGVKKVQHEWKAPRARASVGSKAPARKATRATRTPRAAAPSSVAPIRDQFTKAELLDFLVDKVGLENVQLRDMKRIYTALEDTILGSLHPRGAGEFALPGIVKFATVKKPAVKGGKRAISPFTKEEYITKPKAATIKVKARALTKVRKAALGIA